MNPALPMVLDSQCAAPLKVPRTYSNESGSLGTNDGYAKLGAQAYSGSGGTVLTIVGLLPPPAGSR